LYLRNSTVSGNKAFQGGGIYNSAGRTILLENASVLENDAEDGGGVWNDSGTGVVDMRNSVLAANGAVWLGNDCQGTVNSLGYNLVQRLAINEGDTPGCVITGDSTSVLTWVDPMVGILDYYGGITKSHAPLPSSPLVDAGNPAVPGSAGNSCLAMDQRGVVRPQGAACDIGAHEATAQFKVTKTVNDIWASPGQVVTFTINVENTGALRDSTIIISDSLPYGLEWVGPPTVVPSQPGLTLAQVPGDLPTLVAGLDLGPGESVDIFYPMRVAINLPNLELLKNVADATGTLPASSGSADVLMRSGMRVLLPIILTN